jgi:hypothetical protein
MTRNLGFALLCVVFSACATDSDMETDAGLLDPTGNWSVMYNFAPACGRAATTTTGVFTVTVGPNGYSVEVAGVASVGSLVCTSDACKLSGTFAWMASSTGYEQSMNLVLDSTGRVAGNGSETVVTSDSSCTYTFTVSGSKM